MEIQLFCVTPDEELFPRIRENCARVKDRVRVVPAHEGAAVLVAGGPSMRDRIHAIRMRHLAGQKIFALNGAAKFLNDHAIIPDYQVLLDPQPYLRSYLGLAKEYLIASQCHPDVFEAIEAPKLWHIATEHAEENTPQHPDGDCLVGGGYTVGLTAMCLAYAMGYRTLHLYGYDSSVTKEGDHAYPHPVYGSSLKYEVEPVAVVTIGGQKFRTTLTLAKQAEVFPKLCDDLNDAGCLITADCDGLIMAVINEMKIPTAAVAA
jgi:hypothetical protein